MLTDAGHKISGVLVTARRVNPDFSAAAASFWEQQTAAPFTWA